MERHEPRTIAARRARGARGRLLRAADLAVLAVAAGSVAVTVGAFAGGLAWTLDLLTHFRWQYAAIELLALPALLALGRRRIAAVTAAALGLNLVALGPYLPGLAAASAARDGDDVVLATANLYKRNVDTERTAAMIERAAPDVLVLTEFTHDWDARLAALEALYPHRLEAPRHDAFGIAVWSRLPLAEARVIDLAGAPAIDARVSAPDGTFRLLGVHLRAPTARQWARERDAQLAAIGAWAAAAAEPVAVAGDFNSTPYSPHFAAMLEAGRLRTTAAGSGFHFTWPSFLPLLGIPIDHCAVSADFTVLEHRRLPPFGSDHYAILARLALAEPR